MPVLGIDYEDIRKSYNYLRLGLLLATVMLAASVGREISLTGKTFREVCLQNSFSAYYYTPVRAVFVGALVAIGLALIVIKGKGWEDLFLNCAGLFAPVVAFVPTVNVGTCYSFKSLPSPIQHDGGLSDWVTASVSNNMFALLVAGSVAVVAAVVLFLVFRKDTSADPDPDPDPDQAKKDFQINLVGLLVLAGLVVLGSVVFRNPPEYDTVRWTHNVAAIGMFAALAAAAVMSGRNNWRRGTDIDKWFAIAYWIIAGAMLASALLFFLPTDQNVFWVEAAEIFWFALFWLLQTVDHWKDPAPSTL